MEKLTPTGSQSSEEKNLSTNAQSVLNCFKLHREGRRPQVWWHHRLTPDEYTEVLRVPDGAEFPGGIIEVCYSHKVRVAADLADDGILDTNGSVN